MRYKKKNVYLVFVEKTVLKEVVSRCITNHENNITPPPNDICVIIEMNNSSLENFFPSLFNMLIKEITQVLEIISK